jgi:hypothetical protein
VVRAWTADQRDLGLEVWSGELPHDLYVVSGGSKITFLASLTFAVAG